MQGVKHLLEPVASDLKFIGNFLSEFEGLNQNLCNHLQIFFKFFTEVMAHLPQRS
jgi:hypothetical protein